MHSTGEERLAGRAGTAEQAGALPSTRRYKKETMTFSLPDQLDNTLAHHPTGLLCTRVHLIDVRPTQNEPTVEIQPTEK